MASNQVVSSSVQGNVTGSVGSVAGAVGSVTGAVGSVTNPVVANQIDLRYGASRRSFDNYAQVWQCRDERLLQ